MRRMPTFMINIHKIDDVKDAEAYIARLRGFPKLFDQLLVNLKVREEKGVVAPRFVFPLVLDACHKIIQGRPFDTGPNTTFLANHKKGDRLRQSTPRRATVSWRERPRR